MKVAYIRVSTEEQNEARQFIAMEEFGVMPENIFLDKQSGNGTLTVEQAEKGQESR